MESNIKRALCLAGGCGTRLKSLTKVTSKQLLGIYDRPCIAFPLQTLKDMGYIDILIINANEEQQKQFKILLEDGKRFGLNFSYAIQDYPRGLADAFIVGEEFIKDADEICLILGDNVIIGNSPISNGVGDSVANTIYTYKVKDPSAYGVVKTDEDGNIVEIVEKPKEFISEDAVIGLYVFTNTVVEMAKKVKPSARGELEIVDLIRLMNEEEGVFVEKLDGFWFDIGNADSLLDCANLVRTIDKRSNHTIGLDLS
jgi:glucose-1-phosphate thymidylyltransferase